MAAPAPLPAILFQNTAAPVAPGTLALLAPEDLSRADRFHFPRDRQRWINGRAWLRQELCRLLPFSGPPSQLPITPGPNGRPFLADHPHLDFNLSHTGDWITLATCQTGRVGIDLDTIDPAFPAREIAAEFFLPPERDWIAAGPVDRFFQLWTAKEALMKATGQGLSLPPDRILATLTDDRPTHVTNLETGTTHPLHTFPGPADSRTTGTLIHLSAP